MNFEPQMAAMTWAAAKSVAQAEKSLSGICKASDGDFAWMGQQASCS